MTKGKDFNAVLEAQRDKAKKPLLIDQILSELDPGVRGQVEAALLGPASARLVTNALSEFLGRSLSEGTVRIWRERHAG